MEESLPKLININDNSIIPINTPMFSLGRSLSCNHVIESMNVSRVHCFIKKDDKKCTLIDRSTNGTIVNGEVIKFNAATDLNNGDLIKFGTILYEFRDNNNHNQNTTTTTTTKMEDEKQKNQPTTSKLNNDDHDKSNDDNDDDNNELLEKSLNTSLDCRNIEEIADAELLPVAEEFEIPFETNSTTPTTTNNDNDKNIDNKENEIKIESKLNKSVENTVDTELTCSICSELFIKAVTLTCSHTFCKYCINEWQKNRKQCPICRQAITTITPTIVLDNLIEHIITNRPEDERESRQQQIKYREEKLSEAGPSNNQKKRRRTQQSHRPQQQRRRRRLRGGRQETETITTSNGTVIHIVSDDDDYNNNDDDDDDGDNDSIIDTFDDDFLYDDSDGSYNDDDDDDFDGSYTGLPGHYYGGYGRCYICGDHGHWANGCPLKRRF